jgi:hypothetical protein
MRTKHLVWLACGLAASGCAASATNAPPSASAALLQARGQLTADIQKCTETYGYSPRQATAVAEHALAPHELEWNQCAYGAVRTYEAANPALAPMYEALVSSYQTMTDEVAHGTLTRSERQARTDQKLAAIEQAENSQIAGANLQQAQQQQQQQNVIDTIRMLGAPGFR